MILLLLLQAIILAAGMACWNEFRKPPNRGLVTRKVLALGLAILIAAGAATIVTTTMLIQDALGISVGAPRTRKEQARQWLAQHATPPPGPRDVGRNIRIVNAGLAFFREARSSLPMDMHMAFDRYSRLPSAPSRLLSPSEEREYYDAATDIVRMIEAVAGAADATGASTSGKANSSGNSE